MTTECLGALLGVLIALALGLVWIVYWHYTEYLDEKRRPKFDVRRSNANKKRI